MRGYELGSAQSKPAKDFRAQERGLDKQKYCRINDFWSMMEEMIRAGYKLTRYINVMGQVNQ